VDCKSCGAKANTSRLTCEFCGTAFGTIETAEQELNAIKELTQTAGVIAGKARADRSTQLSRMFPEREVARALGAFWSSVFTPQSQTGRLQMLMQVLSACNPKTGTATPSEDNSALTERSRMLLLALKMDETGETRQKVQTMEQELERKIGEWETTEAREWETTKKVGIGFAIIGGSLVLILILWKIFS
jgi:HAMP domain-containing protein